MNFLKNKWLNYLLIKEARLSLGMMLMGLGVSIYLGQKLPLYTAELYQNVGKGEIFNQSLIALALVFIVEYFNRACYQISTDRYIQHLISYARCSCYEKWMLSIEAKSENGKDPYTLGEVLARIMSDTDAMRELISSGSFSVFIDFSFIISCLVSFLRLNSTSGVIFITAEVAVCLLLFWGSRYLAQLYVMIRKINSDLSRAMANITAGFRQTYYTPHYNYASISTEDVSELFLKKQLLANNWETSYYSIADSLFPFFLCLLAFVFPYTHITEMAVIAALIDLIQRSIAPIKDVTGKLSSIQRAMTGVERMDKFLHDLEKTPASKLNVHHELNGFRELKVMVGNFCYSDQSSFNLKEIEFTGHSGELIGIVGVSGSGKSTLLNILSCNILCPDAELIITDGQGKNISQKTDFDLVRSSIGIVAQDSHIFSRDLEFNITLGLKTHEEFKDFWEKTLGQILYLKHWSIKPETLIKPQDLSLGQKQLISALRSCFLQKPIVLFDEISSALDSELELALREMILLIQKQSLTIIVAHRIETVMEADQILVLDKGRLVSSGKHHSLLKTSFVYQQFIAEISS